MDRVERVVYILDYLATAGQACGVTEISKKLNLDKSSVSRILTTLEGLKWVVQSSDSSYSLGIKPLEFGLAVLSHIDVRKISGPYLTELNALTGETAALSIRTGYEEVFLDQVECKQPIRAVLELGIKGPFWCGGSGKSMLAYLGKDEVDLIIDELRKSGDIILASGKKLEFDRLREELAEIRKLGYAISIGERSAAAVCIASPIFDQYNKVIGCIGVTGPLPRFSERVARSFGAKIKDTAQNISAKMGSSQKL